MKKSDGNGRNNREFLDKPEKKTSVTFSWNNNNFSNSNWSFFIIRKSETQDLTPATFPPFVTTGRTRDLNYHYHTTTGRNEKNSDER